MIFFFLLSGYLFFISNPAEVPLSASSQVPVQISVIKDTEGNWTIDSLMTSDKQAAFDNSPLENPYFGYTTVPHWFRIKLPKSVSDQEVLKLVVKYAGIYNVMLFDGYPDPGVHVSGRKYPVEEWQVHSRIPEFKSYRFDETNAIYLRIQEEASLITPIRVMTESQYSYWQLVEQSLYGIFFGLVISMILYNLMLFLTLQDITYLYYILAMAAAAMVALIRSGIPIIYWWPENAGLDGQAYLVSAGVSIMASSRFASHFLNFPKTNKLLDYYLWGITGLASGLVILSFFYSFVELTNYGRFLVLVGVPSYIVIGIIAWVRGYRPSRFFIFAWVPYISGLVLIVLRGGGWIGYNPLIDISAEIGTSVEAVLLSLALADRISTYKREKAEAENRSLKAEVDKKALVLENQRLEYDLKLREKDLQNEKQQLATTTLWLTQKNKVLKDVQKSLNILNGESGENKLAELGKKISQNLNADEDWYRFKEHFEKVHSGFFAVLETDFAHLTQNEQRLCAFLRMNLSSKEIAIIQGVSLNAVEQARRRLRKKLGLANTETNLLAFLQGLTVYNPSPNTE